MAATFARHSLSALLDGDDLIDSLWEREEETAELRCRTGAAGAGEGKGNTTRAVV